MSAERSSYFIESLNGIKNSQINNDEKKTYFDTIFKENHLMKHIKDEDKVLINEQIYNDLEMFTTEDPIFHHIDKTQTQFGSNYLKLLLKMPISNSDFLKNRQTLAKLLNQKNYSCELNTKLHECQNLSDDLLWFWKPPNQEMKNLIDIVYYKYQIMQFANRKTSIMNFTTYLNIYLLPLIQILSPFIPVFIIFLIARQTSPNIEWKMIFKLMRDIYKININSKIQLIGLFIWILVYLYSVYSVITNAILQYKIIQLIHTKLHSITLYKNHCQKIYEIYKIICLNKKDLSINLNTIDKSLTYLNNLLKIENPVRFFDNKGYVLSSFQNVYQNEDIRFHLTVLSQFIGYIDCLLSISQLHKNNYCFANFDDPDPGKSPHLTFSQIWHPCLDHNQSVKNSSTINSHRIITGPNAGGKSTYIKNVAILSLMAQSLTVCNCKQVFMTPFKLIHTYIHLIDTKGVESLFEAEMNRCYEFIKIVQTLKKKEYAFAIFDELFTSTNFPEGISAAYSICLEFNKNSNLLTLMTTHYSQLSELEKISNSRFKNYKVCIKKSADGQILFNYKIRKGVSNQFIALDLLKLKGFEPEIVNNAMQYLNHLKYVN